MRQALLLEPGRLEMRDVPMPEPGEGELILRIDAALTCGTDLKTYRRGHPKLPMPTPLGHEFTGTVSAVGKGITRFREGDPVMAAPSAPCERCRPCLRGLESLCENINGTTMAWGAFADYLRLPAHVVRRNTFLRPAGLDLATAALLEPLSCVVAGVEHLSLLRRDTALILGAGPIGLLYVALLRRRGVPRIVVVGKREGRLEAARRFGADAIVDLDAVEDVDAAVFEAVGEEGACTVVECVGRASAWSQAMRWARKGGEVLFYGGCPSGTQVPMDAGRVHYDALSLKGAFHFSPSDVRIALDLLCQNQLDLSPLISGELPLEQLEHGLQRLIAGEAIKLAIRP